MKLPNMQEEVKRFTRVQKILISVICVFVLFGGITIFTGPNAVSKFGYDMLSMLRYSLIDHPAETISNWQRDLADLRGVHKENDELRNIIASQDLYKAELDESKRKIEELEALMDLDSVSLYDKEYASVISRDIATWSDTITLNKGSDDGIAVDMAVVSSKGLLGKVISVSKNSCKVKLLSTSSDDVNVSLNIELKSGTTGGILQGYDENEDVYVMQTFDANAQIEKGMKVITSGSGGVFPAGILVGQVWEVSDVYNATGKVIKVTPSVNFNDFEYVAILKVK